MFTQEKNKFAVSSKYEHELENNLSIFNPFRQRELGKKVEEEDKNIQK
jgi:hypothetical protein